MKTTKPTLVLRCFTENEHGYSHVKFYPMVQTEAGQLEELGCSDEFGGNYVKDLLISDQIDDRNTSSTGQRDYAWECGFKSHFIGLRDAKGMVKTLTMIHRKSTQLREQFGHCTNYGQFVCRVANCLGVSAIVFDSKRFEGQQQELKPGEAIDRINELVEGLSRKLRGEPTIEEARAAA